MKWNESDARKEALEKLSGGGAPVFNAVVGFDGFIDEIIHVVDRREGVGRYEEIRTIREFAERIASAAGKSANVELVPVRTKLGGNGPIMASALNSLGARVTYVGNLGSPRIHPVFEEFAGRCEVISPAEPAHTDALEFRDGKLMLGKMTVLEGFDWELLTRALPLARMAELMAGARLTAMVNWTMLPWMTDIWRRMRAEVCPMLPESNDRFAFFDLADPQKRLVEDLAAALEEIRGFSDRFKVILGLNEREAAQVARALGVGGEGRAAEENCEAVASAMGIYCVVTHPVSRACAFVGGRLFVQPGPYTKSPEIVTGAGDHFNAGFCFGQVAGLSPAASLLTGVACSGCYVRTAVSPDLETLMRFIETGEKWEGRSS